MRNVNKSDCDGEKQMYPLLPLQLFGLRKELEKASQQEDIQRLKELSYQLKELASQLALSGKNLSDIYLPAKSTHFSIASGEYVIP